MTQSDELRIKVGGRELSGWQEVRVTRGVERVVSDFDVTLTEHYPGADRVVVAPGQPCEIYLGEDLVVTGYVDCFQPEFDAHNHTVRVAGRSKTQDIVDGAAIWPGGQVVNSDLVSVARTLSKPFGIEVSTLTDVGAEILQTVIGPGDIVFDVIEPMARYCGVLMYDDPRGNLVFSRVGNVKAASGFVEGDNVEAAGVAYRMDQRFSEYSAFRVKLSVLNDKGDEGNLIATVKDTEVPRYRPKFIVAETNGGGFDIAEKRAKWEMVRRVGRSAAVHVVADSWRDAAGKLWTPNTLAEVALPSLKLDRVTWLISEVTYTRGAGGTHARVTLMHPSSFIPQPFVYQPFPADMAEAIKKAVDR